MPALEEPVKIEFKALTVVALAAFASACSSTTVNPASGSVSVGSDVSSLPNDGTKANLTATATQADGKPASGTIVFTASAGDMNGTATVTATVNLDATGKAKVTYACNVAVDSRCGAGKVLITAVTNNLTGGAQLDITGPGGTTGTGTDGGTVVTNPDGGTVVVGPPTIIIETAETPSVLGLKGSGIQEHGLMTFLVTDSSGNPVSGAAVTFAQATPNLVTLGHTTGTSDTTGHVVVDYAAGGEVGVSSISATLTVNGAVASHPIAVRGARPSASGFYFRCGRINLPVYTTTLQYETSACVVRLKDRDGNRVGIPTPVSFATEAGAISASAVTKAFDFNDPTDPEEGSVTVTFSSDLGNGFRPADTAPLAADATQFPKPRGAEPSTGSNCTTASASCQNPRDQLVTIIAMVRGEEAFVDANHNGQYDTGELFVDQGDPFVDSNDNDIYDSASEVRFCGSSDCSAYHGPNGVWDSDRTLWVPTWVVFTAAAGAVSGSVDPWLPGSCADYTDNNGSFPSIITTRVRFLDPWLNVPTIGTTYAATLKTTTPAGLTLTTTGGNPELDNLGSMDVSWERVSAANPTKDCTVANTTNGVCITKTEFGGWDSGYRIGLVLLNANKTPPVAVPGHACGTPTAGTAATGFTIDVTATQPHVTSHIGAFGTFAYVP